MNTKHIVVIGIALLALGAGALLISNRGSAPQENFSPASIDQSISLTVEGLYTQEHVSMAAETTMLELLRTLDASDPNVRLATKEYSGLGTLVTGMNGMENGTGNNYWQYTVNGVMPQIGADMYLLKDGDMVQWFFATSQQ